MSDGDHRILSALLAPWHGAREQHSALDPLRWCWWLCGCLKSHTASFDMLQDALDMTFRVQAILPAHLHSRDHPREGTSGPIVDVARSRDAVASAAFACMRRSRPLQRREAPTHEEVR